MCYMCAALRRRDLIRRRFRFSFENTFDYSGHLIRHWTWNRTMRVIHGEMFTNEVHVQPRTWPNCVSSRTCPYIAATVIRHSGLEAPTSSGFRSGTRDTRVARALFHFSKFTFYCQAPMSAREGFRKVRLCGTVVR